MTDPTDRLFAPERLAALRATMLLASPPEAAFDRLTRLTAKLLRVPVALISLVDADHQFFKSQVGLCEPWSGERRTPLSHSFCQHVVTAARPLAINDAREHPLVRDNPAIPDLGVVAYLGAPLTTSDGSVIGSLCAIDHVPRDWTAEQIDMIGDLAALVGTEIESRRTAEAAAEACAQLREAEAEAESRAKVRMLADAMPQIVWTAGPDGNLDYYNQRWFDYTGLSFDETKNWGWQAVMHPDDLSACVAAWTAAIATGRGHEGEYRLKQGSDGAYRWHLCRSLPTRDPGGVIRQWVGTCTDVHETRLARVALEETRDVLERRVAERTLQLMQEHRFIEAVLDNIADGVIACDKTGRVTYLNPAVRRMSGFDGPFDQCQSGEWASEHLALYDTATGRRLTWDERPLALAMSRGAVDRAACEIRGIGDAPPRTVLISARAMTGPDGRVFGAVATWHDVTDARRTQRQLQAAREAADAANAAKSEFLANMSHEIRTPISAIIGFAELLLRPDPSPQEHDEHVQVVRRNAKHLLDLINDILDLSKIEAGKMTVEPGDCDVPALMADLMSTMRPRAAEKTLKLELAFAGPTPRVIRTDGLRLRQILMNLLGNAIKFTEHGAVAVTVRYDSVAGQGRLRVDVKDSGIGMNAGQIDRLFRPFSQADESTTRRFGGTGLGLTISRDLARLLGGDITVQSAEGIGSLFGVSVDCGPADGLELLEGLRESVLPAAPLPTTDVELRLSGRVLLAEDGRDNQRLLTTHLRHAGCEVTLAENGQIAVDLATTQAFDLVLMDMQMPVMDGYTATRELRRRGVTVPVVALTANAMAEDRAKCLASGCTDYLSKPVQQAVLLKTAAAHLPKASAASPIHSALAGEAWMAAILEEFIDGLPAEIARLQALAAGADLKPLCKAIHELRGAGGGYGFAPITEHAASVEKAILAADHRSAIDEKLISLLDVIRRVERADK